MFVGVATKVIVAGAALTWPHTVSEMLGKLQDLRIHKLPPWLREFLIVVAFLALTALMTWPWVTHLRDAVSDRGDPYMIAWTLWWDYHQTFNDPLNLFHANVFFPYHYTLAFSEHDYGIALLFFPLFALGLRPLTVHSVATFCGFAFCGYGAFRLARTMTGSSGAAWVAGVVFAFIPFRFQLLSHLHYLFAGWIPLLLEALVLFVRVRSWRRAAWLGAAFLMNGLTCITWLILTLVPLTLSGAVLVVRHRIWRERAFWVRGVLTLAVSSLLLLPFLWPYYKVSKLYGFKWPPEEAVKNSAGASDWLSAEPRVKVWNGFGSGLPDIRAHLFPGLLPLLLPLAALVLVSPTARGTLQPLTDETSNGRRKRWLYVLDGLCLAAGVVAILAAGYSHSQLRFFRGGTTDRALFILTAALVARFAISYPQFLRRSEGQNLIASLRSERRSDPFWLGLIWTVAGFLASLGMGFFLNRVINNFLLPFRSLRIPARAAMLCYVGLALLAGLGAARLAQLVACRRPAIKPWAVYSVIVAALLFELHAAPLAFVRGAVYPDAVTLRLKQTPMRGGLVELPSLPEPPYYSWHLSMLRAADHGRPIVSAASSFISPLTMKVHDMTKGPGMPKEFLDLLEEIPASYVVVRRGLVAPERQWEFTTFFADAVASGRLRFIGSYGGSDDLYAVVKTEPEAQADTSFKATAQQPVGLVLLTESDTEQAAALDSVTLMRDPFSPETKSNFSEDRRTRLTLFAAGVNAGPGSSSSDVIAQIETARGRIYPMTVEYIGNLATPGWLTQLIVRLPDEVSNDGEQWWVSIKVRGVVSNKALVRMKVFESDAHKKKIAPAPLPAKRLQPPRG